MKKIAYLRQIKQIGMKTNKLTYPQIKAAIYYGLDRELSTLEIYRICYPEDNIKDLASKASGWKRGQRVAAIFEEVQNEIRGREEERNKCTKTDENGKSLQVVDFTDKGQFIQYLNQAANRITDDKLKNDILKMLSDHLDFKDESKRDESNQIQRFYLPLRCQDCKLYQETAK